MEMINDILKDMRGANFQPPMYQVWVNKFADRIEAAYKHEADGYKGRIKLWSDRADELRSKCDEQYAELKHKREATCEKSSQVGNAAKMRKALMDVAELIHDEAKWADEMSNQQAIALGIIQSALSAPPRPCDVMSLEAAKKVWFAKEILPRLNGDLPLGKEVPFEEWFVSS